MDTIDPMKKRLHLFAGALIFLCLNSSRAEVRIVAEHRSAGLGFVFNSVPPPANNDAATTMVMTLVDGDRDRNGGQLGVLNDGRVPTGEDQPAANFFFGAGTDGGRVQLDLSGVITVKQVNTYSWHANTRAPQVYTLYAADGTATGFNSAPVRERIPNRAGGRSSPGWTRAWTTMTKAGKTV